MTKEIFCTYEQSKRLKRLGFNIPCWCFYQDPTWMASAHLLRSQKAENFNSKVHLSAPSQDVAHTWLIENKQLFIVVNPQRKNDGKTGFTFSIFHLDDIEPIGWSHDIYDKHWLAMSAALDYGIEYALMQERKK